MKHIIVPAIICLFFILMGYLSKKYPKIISGYKTLKLDRDKTIPDFVKKVSIFTGLIILVGCIFSLLINSNVLYTIFLILPIVAMPLAIILKTLRTSQKAGRLTLILYIICLLIIGGFTIYSISDTQVKIDQNELSISGLYGETINREDIESVTWQDSVPELGIRTNGFSLGNTKKGYFRYDGTNAKVFIETDSKQPSIILRLKNNKIIILSLKNRTKMLELYNSIKVRLTTYEMQ